MAEAARILPLYERMFAGNQVSLTPMEPRIRISLRAGPDAYSAIKSAIGAALPQSPGGTATGTDISALWIGPDEWLLIADQSSDLIASLNKAAKTALISAVDVSHRNTAIEVAGRNAATAINGGCPRDLSLAAFPVGNCSRTILGKAEIILWRLDEDRFHLECWRSFSDYVWKFLVDAARSA